MPLNSARLVLWLVPIVALLSPAARAQSDASLDIRALVASDQVFPSSVDDPVWSVEPQPGRRLVLVPVNLVPGDAAVEVGAPPVDLRGARFVAWRVVPGTSEDDRTSPPPPPNDAPRAGDSRSWSGLLFDSLDPTSGDRPADDDAAHQAVRAASDMLDGGLPVGAPTLTRKFVLHPDGRITFDLERVVPGAAVKEAQEGYALKLRPDLLANLEPQPPRPSAGGGDPRQLAEQRRQEQLRFREEVQKFRELRKAVRELPETFETDLPSRMWAIYEVPENLQAYGFGGEPPLPWSVRAGELDTLRGLARGGSRDAAVAAAGSLRAMANDGQPLTHRAIAIALQEAGVIGQVEPNDPLYLLLRQLIAGPDAEARRIVVTELAGTVPTAGTAGLLREAAPFLSSDMQLMSLRGLLQGDASDAAQAREMVENASRALANPDGPHPGGVIESLAKAAPEPDSPTASLFITGLNFEAIPADRRPAAIAAVIRMAGESPIAAAWLNHRLLNSNDPRLVRQAYELLARASGGAGLMHPLGRSLLAAVFGAPPAGAPRADLTLSGLIPIESTGHGIFRGLSSGDPTLRALAWRSLPNFRVADAGGARDGDAAATAEIVSTIMNAGLQQPTLPLGLVRFLARQTGSPQATESLVRLVLIADGQAGKAAARALLGSGRDLAPALEALQPSDRAEFAGQLYQALTYRVPVVTGLLADPEARGGLVRWFADAVAAGELPEPAAWANQYGDESALLAAAAASDARVAGGGIGGLVAQAGGDEETAIELALRFQAMPQNERTPEAISQRWSEEKANLYARRLEGASGPYRVLVRIFEPGAGGHDPATGEAAAGAPTQTIAIGVVDLSVQGQTALLGNQTVTMNVASDQLALELNPIDLRNFPVEELQDVPFERLMGPMILAPREDGAWRGGLDLPDGQRVDVLLEPVSR